MAFAHALHVREFVSQVQQQLVSLGGPGKCPEFVPCSSLRSSSGYGSRSCGWVAI